MKFDAKFSSNEQILPLRTRQRAEMNCQITKDSIHSRKGWALSYLLHADDLAVGFGSVAIAGPWTEKPTLFEFYVLPEQRHRAFDLFEAFLEAGKPQFFEIQSNDLLLTALTLAYARDIATEAIVFQDKITTALPANGATLRCVTPEAEIKAAIEWRQGGGEWVLESGGADIAKGGILFHYNRPYGDIYMDVNEPFRRRGFGSYLVQELKRIAHTLGAIPAARCNPTNIPSRKTLQRAGFVPAAHILMGSIGWPSAD
jgi:GNAT superfamily N-acetyltransferase